MFAKVISGRQKSLLAKKVLNMFAQLSSEARGLNLGWSLNKNSLKKKKKYDNKSIYHMMSRLGVK